MAGEPPAEAVEASAAIVAYLTDLVEARRAAPEEDLVSVLVSATDDGDRLTHQELLSSLFQLIVAGHDTTTSLIGNGVVALLDHPDLRPPLVPPDLLPFAVEELLRFDTPVPHATFRVTTEEIDLGTAVVPKGKQVLVCLGAANRDPGHWADPDVLDLRRPPRPHLGFGHGDRFFLGIRWLAWRHTSPLGGSFAGSLAFVWPCPGPNWPGATATSSCSAASPAFPVILGARTDQ